MQDLIYDLNYAFSLDQSNILLFGKELEKIAGDQWKVTQMACCLFTKQTNLRLVQIENIGNKINVNEKLKFGLGRVENIVGKGENASYQHFSLFPTIFSKALCSGSSKVSIV